MKLGQNLLGELLLSRGQQLRPKRARPEDYVTYLLASAGVESHDHSVHEGDVELFGEVENALQDGKSRRSRRRPGGTYLHGGDGIDGRVGGVVVVVVGVER